MIEAVLFDIDNTLILFDETAFIRAYISRLIPHFLDFFTPEAFHERLMEATRALLSNRGHMSNADFYLNHFTRGLHHHRREIEDRFFRFYELEFNDLSTLTRPVDHVAETMEALQKKELKMIIASNPFWPLNVQKMRLSWAGVGHIPFAHITHIDNTSACKPQPAYYEEICRRTGIAAERCLMTGNDPVNDMIAGITGMKTYLTTDAANQGFSSTPMSADLRRRTASFTHKPDFQGAFSELPNVVESLSSR